MTGEAALPLPDRPKTNTLNRGQVLFTSLLGFFASLLFFVPKFPFSKGLCAVSLASAFLHLGLFGLFPKVPNSVWNGVNLLNILLLGFALHFSGGILSPFSMFLVFIFISGAGYGIRHPVALWTAMATFIAVILGEYAGVLTPLAVTPQAVYSSPLLTLLIVVTVLGHMYTSGEIYKVTVAHLRSMLDREQADADAMRRNLADLEALSQLGRLAAKITHDVRGPLGAFRGLFQELSADPATSPTNRKDCDLMVREVDRMADMLGHILKYVRPGESRRETIRLADVINTVLSVIRFHPDAKDIRFVPDFGSAEELRVLANKEELQQIFFNICKNSVEALQGRPGEKTVSVSLTREGPSAALRFRDNGPGMTKDLLDRLSRESFTTKAAGGGLGLQITRELVTGYGGRMEILSDHGTGTEIALWLPAL